MTKHQMITEMNEQYTLSENLYQYFLGLSYAELADAYHVNIVRVRKG